VSAPAEGRGEKIVQLAHHSLHAGAGRGVSPAEAFAQIRDLGAEEAGKRLEAGQRVGPHAVAPDWLQLGERGVARLPAWVARAHPPELASADAHGHRVLEQLEEHTVGRPGRRTRQRQRVDRTELAQPAVLALLPALECRQGIIGDPAVRRVRQTQASGRLGIVLEVGGDVRVGQAGHSVGGVGRRAGPARGVQPPGQPRTPPSHGTVLLEGCQPGLGERAPGTTLHRKRIPEKHGLAWGRAGFTAAGGGRRS
jgi:hypothetical protein